jgi:hypothetical protein
MCRTGGPPKDRQSCLASRNHPSWVLGTRHSFHHRLFSPTQADSLAVTQVGDHSLDHPGQQLSVATALQPL